jgi:hypothetical protein
MLETYRRTVAGALLAAMASMIADSADPDQPFRPIGSPIPVILITLFTMPEEGTANRMTWRWTATTDG